MEWFASFRPQGPVNLLPAIPNNKSATTVGGPTAGDVAFLAINPTGPPDVFLFYGPTSSTVASAVVPVIPSTIASQVNAPAGCGVLHMPGGSIQVFTLTA